MDRRCPVLVLLVWLLCACGGPAQATGGEGWSLLDSEFASHDPVVYLGGDLRIALDDSTYRAHWTDGHMSSTPPTVDFETHLVVRVDRFSNDDCPDVIFEGIEQTDDRTVSLIFHGARRAVLPIVRLRSRRVHRTRAGIPAFTIVRPTAR